jgi:RNA polymerase sigma-70 factor (ECF subfamily)
MFCEAASLCRQPEGKDPPAPTVQVIEMGVRLVAEPEPDIDILEGCRRGDPTAQRRLFERYADRVHSIALHYLRGDEAGASDVTQEVFVKVFRTTPSFRAEARLGTWLYRITANACIDELRRRRRLVFFGDLPSALHGSVTQTGPESGAADVAAAVGRLSPRLRLTVLLRYFDDLSYDDIARALGCTPGTVASRLHRAHAILARQLAHLRHARPSGQEPGHVADA